MFVISTRNHRHNLQDRHRATAKPSRARIRSPIASRTLARSFGNAARIVRGSSMAVAGSMPGRETGTGPVGAADCCRYARPGWQDLRVVHPPGSSGAGGIR